MIKNSEVRDDFCSKNIDSAKEKLRIMNMSAEDRRKYDKFLVNLAAEEDVVETARQEGRKAERKNTEKEKRRADKEKERADKAEKEKEKAEKEKEKVEKEKDLSIEKALKSGKLTLEEIADLFGVSVDYINRMK
jgi:DNA-nicking Smr family endonuclease